MDELRKLECRTGPLPEHERWILRFGGEAAYRRASARAAIRQLTRACMAARDGQALRQLLHEQADWRGRLAALV